MLYKTFLEFRLTIYINKWYQITVILHRYFCFCRSFHRPVRQLLLFVWYRHRAYGCSFSLICLIMTTESLGRYSNSGKHFLCHLPDIVFKKPWIFVRGKEPGNNLFRNGFRDYLLGSMVRIILDVGLLLTVLITRESCRDLHLEPWCRVYATFKASAVHVISVSSH